VKAGIATMSKHKAEQQRTQMPRASDRGKLGFCFVLTYRIDGTEDTIHVSSILIPLKIVEGEETEPTYNLSDEEVVLEGKGKEKEKVKEKENKVDKDVRRMSM